LFWGNNTACGFVDILDVVISVIMDVGGVVDSISSSGVAVVDADQRCCLLHCHLCC